MQRIQKFLSAMGISSRRSIEEWIKLGKIQVNGKIATLGLKVNGDEEISLDGKLLDLNKVSLQQQVKLLLYHKPVGKICSRSDPLNRPSVFSDLPEIKYGKWVAVGRLDLNTSGILLFTNSGELAHKLMHPSFNREREYLVRVYGEVNFKILDKLTKGVLLSDGVAKFKEIELLNQKAANSWYRVVLTEGKNREIKRLFLSQQLIVNRLIRIRFGDILLPKGLKLGGFEYINLGEKFL